GGVLNIVRHEIPVRCPADAIPDHFDVDLTGLEIGNSVHISAIKLTPNVRPTVAERDFTVATIVGRTAEEPAPGAAVAAEAVEPGAEGAEGAAPAEAAAAAAEDKEKPKEEKKKEEKKKKKKKKYPSPGGGDLLRGIPAPGGLKGNDERSLFAGRGTRGAKCALNRHNVGFMAVDAIAATHDFPAWRKRFSGLAAEG